MPFDQHGRYMVGAMSTAARHKEAREALLVAFPRVVGRQPNLAELQILQAQAGLESTYCSASYPLLDHATGAIISKSGNINNCGAVQTNDPAHGVLATDRGSSHVTDENPKGYYDHLYAVYPTLADGLEAMVKQFVVRRPTSWAHAMRGDIDSFTREAHAEYLPGGGVKVDPETKVPGYFEISPESRAKGTEQWVDDIASALGEVVAAKRGGPVDSVMPDTGVIDDLDEPNHSPIKIGFVGLIIGGIVVAIKHWWWPW